jgi:hypothetical protein
MTLRMLLDLKTKLQLCSVDANCSLRNVLLFPLAHLSRSTTRNTESVLTFNTVQCSWVVCLAHEFALFHV